MEENKNSLQGKNDNLVYWINNILQENMYLNNRLEKLNEDYLEALKLNNKRIRKKADDIDRDFHCPNKNCKRSYGFYSSLIIHIKNKHREYYIPNLRRGRKQNYKPIENFSLYLVKNNNK